MSLNLLPSEAKFLANRIKFRKQVMSVTYLMVEIWIAVVVIIYGVWFLFRQINLADAKKLEVSQTAYGKLSSYLVTNQKLRYKVKLVSSILDQRFEYAKAFRTIEMLFPPTVMIRRFELQNDGTFAVDGEVGSHGTMDEVEKRLLEINQGKSADFKTAIINQLSVVGKQWSFSLNVALK